MQYSQPALLVKLLGRQSYIFFSDIICYVADCILYNFSVQEACILAKLLVCIVLIVFKRDLLINKISLTG
jgi:hypothetical protein